MDRMREIERKAASVGGISHAERDEWHRLHVRKVQVFQVIAGKVIPYTPPAYFDYQASDRYFDATRPKERKDTLLEL